MSIVGHWRGAVGIAGLLFAVGASGCSGCSASGTMGSGGDAGPGGGDGGMGMDAMRPPPVDGALPTPDATADAGGYCEGIGPPVLVGDTTGSMTDCAGSIAARVFNNSVCTCTDLNVGGYFKTRSFHSITDPAEVGSGGPVGVNGTDTNVGYTDIGGTFVIAGATSLRFAGYLQAGGDFKANGAVDSAGVVEIARDAWVHGNITAIGTVSVGRDLHQPAGARVLSFSTDVGGSRVSGDFTVDPPCDCAPEHIVDIAAIVDRGMIDNDNASVPLDPSALASVVGLGVDITLPCGRFYLDSIGGVGDITLHVDGRTALFVGGDVNALGVLNVEIGPDGELDVFIKGNLLGIGLGSWGTRERPRSTRLYVGGTSDVTIIGASGFVGNVYAPNARITAVGATTLYGSIFGRVIDMPGYLDVHYDRAILDAGDECPPPPGGCDMCSASCGPSACIGGMCAPCASDADCCAPLVCYPDGTCGSLII